METTDDANSDLFLHIGTAVSAKFRGAFCEARISDCSQNVKYKVFLTKTNETITVNASEIELLSTSKNGNGASVYPINTPVKFSKTNQVGLVRKVIDASTYTIIFDDNDQSTVLRHQLKLKGQKHFEDFETLDLNSSNQEINYSQANPNQPLDSIRSRSKRQSRNSLNCDVLDAKPNFSTSESESNNPEEYYSSATEDEETNSPANVNNWILTHLDQVVWVEKSRGSSFPGLVIDPWETDKKRDAGNHCIIRSFRDSRFYSIPFKYIKPFDRSQRSDKPQLQFAIDTAGAYITDNVLPKTWAITYRQIFVDIMEFLQDNSVPEYVTSGAFSIELGRLFYCVWRLGGFEVVCQMKLWPTVCRGMSKANLNWGSTPSPGFIAKMKSDCKKYLSTYHDVFEERLGGKEDNPLPSIEFSSAKSDVIFKTEVIRPSSAPSQIPQRRIRCVDDQIEVSYKDGKIYPAKIVKIDTSRPSELGIYFVHYKNWNSRHDQWISEELIIGPEVVPCSPSTPAGTTVKSVLERKETPGENPAVVSESPPVEHRVGSHRRGSSNVAIIHADSLSTTNNGSPPIGDRDGTVESPKETNVSSEVKAQCSSLSQKIAEKRNKMMQSSASENSEASCNIFKSKARFGQRLSPAAKKEEIEQKRQLSISSSDDDTPEKFPVRSPRKLPARRRTPKKSQSCGASLEKVASVSVEEKSPVNVRRKLSATSDKGLDVSVALTLDEPQPQLDANVSPRKRSAASNASEINEASEEFDEKVQEVSHQTFRSPPKRHRIVKRASESSDKVLPLTPSSSVKEDTIGSPEHLKVEKEEPIDDEATGGDTNDEGFSADEECESDDTIDMNKPVSLTSPGFKDLPVQASDVSASNAQMDTVDNKETSGFPDKMLKDEDLAELEPSARITRGFLSRLDLPQRTETPVFQLPLDDNTKSETDCPSTRSAKGESVCVESPTTSRSFKKNKKGALNASSDVATPIGSKTEVSGTPAPSSRKSARRNGKSGQYKHGFFISDPEDSEVDDFGSGGMGDCYDVYSRQNSANQNENRCNLNFYTFQNPEDDQEKILDVSVLDEIDDVDERIRIAEEQMNLIRKRYNQIYKEMEKLDNLQRRIRKRNKLKQKDAHENLARTVFQEDSNESPGKNGGDVSQDQLSDFVAVTSTVNQCEVSPTSGLDTLSTVSSKLCWAVNESLCSSSIAEPSETYHQVLQHASSREKAVETSIVTQQSTEPITSTASGMSNITEDQLNAVESLMSLRSQLP